MKIINRLYSGFALLMLIMLSISLIGLIKISIADKSLNQLSEQTAVEQRQAINFRGSVHDRAIAIRDAVLVNNTNSSLVHQKIITELDSNYQKSAIVLNTMFANLQHSNQEERLLAQIKKTEKETLAITSTLMNLINSNQFDTATDYLLKTA